MYNSDYKIQISVKMVLDVSVQPIFYAADMKIDNNNYDKHKLHNVSNYFKCQQHSSPRFPISGIRNDKSADEFL